MAVSIYYPTSASVYFRRVDGTGLSEMHLDVDTGGTNHVFVISGSWPNTSSIMFIQGYDTGSLYPITASYVLTASYLEGVVGVDVLNMQVFL